MIRDTLSKIGENHDLERTVSLSTKADNNCVTLQVNTGPDGTESIMTIAGMVQSLTGSNPISTKIFTVRAESQDGSTAQVYFPYENNFNMSVLHSAEPINFTLQWTTNISSNNYGTYGVVYDTGDNSSIPVHLSVAGLEQNSQVVPLPSSIDVKINKTSFVLNSSQIYYIPIIVRTSTASVGNHYIAINETIGGKQFLSTLPIYVMPNICLGGPGMCGPQPITGEKSNHTDANVVASPLKQFKSGMSASDVKCNNSLQLILKTEDGSPACVFDSSIARLVRQGWWIWNEKVGDIMVNISDKKPFGEKDCAIPQPTYSIVGTSGFAKDDLPDNGILYQGTNLTKNLVASVIQFALRPNSTASIIFTYDFNSYPGSNCKVTTKDAIANIDPTKPNSSLSDLLGSPDIMEINQTMVRNDVPLLGNSGDVMVKLSSTKDLNDHVVKVTYQIVSKPSSEIGKSYFVGFWWHSAVVVTVGNDLYHGTALSGPRFG